MAIDTLDMVELQVEEQPVMVLPFTGEVIDLRDAAQVAQGLDNVRGYIVQLGEFRSLLETVLRLEGRRQGTKTLYLEDGLKATITGGSRPEWDILELQTRLRRAGLPEARLDDLITETIVYKVSAGVARQIGAANPDYADAIQASHTRVEAPWRVNVERSS